jgi:Fe-S cluster assembly iron-binding protein IscA
LALDEPKENEKGTKVGDIELFMEESIEPFTENQMIDYVDNGSGKGFVVAPEYGSSCC